jgi:hypothetical protein
MMVAGCGGTATLLKRCSVRSSEAFQRKPLREGIGTGYALGFHASLCF